MLLQLDFGEALFLSTVFTLAIAALVLWYFADYYDDDHRFRPY